MIISRTPFRVTFFGGGTDYPAWFKQHGGETLSASIDKYCYITIRYTPSCFEHKTKVVYNEIEKVLDNNEIKHPSVRGCFRYLNIKDGLEIHHESDLPAMRGLGSSSAFTVGLLKALYQLKNIGRDNGRIASDACRIEQDLIKENVGCQDQYTAALGDLLYINWGTGEKHSIPLMRGLEKHLMLFHTGTYRRASDVADGLIKSFPHKEKELLMMQGNVKKGLAYLQKRDYQSFGKLMDANWAIKRALTPEITTPLIDDIYNKAIKAGALGGKLLGAGHGGFMMFVVEPEKQESIRRALDGYTHVPFKFETGGSQIIFQG